MIVVQGRMLVAEEDSIVVVGHRILHRTVVEGNLVEGILVVRRRRIDRIDRVAVVVAVRADLVVAELGVRKVVVHLV